MSSGLRWAVTGGPAGTNPVELPDDRSGARRVEAHHRAGFWCSTEAGGCGGRLVLSAGSEGRPAFRHRDDARCRYAVDGSGAGPAYGHLRYQRVLTAWLAAQGHSSRVEKVPGGGGPSDLHVVVDGGRHALEVQLSPLPDTLWRQRDDRCRTRARHVTWLYGPAAVAAAATEAAVRGASLALRRHGPGLAVGVRDVDDHVRWVPLSACRMDADGFTAPGAEEARALHTRRTAGRREAACRRARQAPRLARVQGDAGGRGARDRTPWARLAPPLPFPA